MFPIEVNKKMFFIAVAGAVLLLIIGGAWYGLRQADEEVLATPSNAPDERSATSSTNNEPTDVDTSEWETYRNEEWGFEVRYPTGWALDREDDSTSFYGPEWAQEKDEFKKDLISPLMKITFKDDIPSIEAWLLQKLAEGKYETIDALVQGEIDIYEYTHVTVNEIVIPVLVLGAETVVHEYYIPLKEKNNYAMIKIAADQDEGLHDAILSTIKTY